MGNLVSVEKVPDIDAHANVSKERITRCHRLLLSITVAIVYKMLWLLGAWHGESILDHDEKV